MATFKNYSLIAHKNFADEITAKSQNSNSNTLSEGDSTGKRIGEIVAAGAGGWLAGNVIQEIGRDATSRLHSNHENIYDMMKNGVTNDKLNNFKNVLVGKTNGRLKELALADMMNPSFYRDHTNNFQTLVANLLQNNTVSPADLARAFLGRGAKRAADGRFISDLPFTWGKDFDGAEDGLNAILDALNAQRKAPDDFIKALDTVDKSLGGHSNSKNFRKALFNALNKQNDSKAATLLCRMLNENPSSPLINSILTQAQTSNEAMKNIAHAIRNSNLSDDALRALNEHGFSHSKIQAVLNNGGKGASINTDFIPDDISEQLSTTAEKMQNDIGNAYTKEHANTHIKANGQDLGTVGSLEKELKMRQATEEYAAVVNRIQQFQDKHHYSDIIAVNSQLELDNRGLALIRDQRSDHWYLTINDSDKFAASVGKNPNFPYSDSLKKSLQIYKELDDHPGLIKHILTYLGQWAAYWGKRLGKRISRSHFFKSFDPANKPVFKHKHTPTSDTQAGNVHVWNKTKNVTDSRGVTAKKLLKPHITGVTAAVLAAASAAYYISSNAYPNLVKNAIKKTNCQYSVFKYDDYYFGKKGIFALADKELPNLLKKKLSDWYKSSNTAKLIFENGISVHDCEIDDIEPLFASAMIACVKQADSNTLAVLQLQICYSSEVELELINKNAGSEESSFNEDSIDIVGAYYWLQTQIKYEDFLSQLAAYNSSSRKLSLSWRLISGTTEIQPVTNMCNGLDDKQIREKVLDYDTSKLIDNPVYQFGFAKEFAIDSSKMTSQGVFNQVARTKDLVEI